MTFVDAGANIGYYTLLTAKLTGTTGRIFAFEPDPTNYSYLVQNAQTNGFVNVRTVPKALSNRTGTGSFLPDSGGAEGFLSNATDGAALFAVPTITLDDFFGAEGWPIVQMIKFDIEGGETDALEGMRELSRRNPALQVIMELNTRAISRAGSTVNGVANLLRDLGFVSGLVIETGRSFSIPREFPSTTATYNLLLLKKHETADGHQAPGEPLTHGFQ
jgi:FkbM family methyltransferase